MAVIDFRKDPSPSELRWFGLGIAAFGLLLGGIWWWRGAPPATSLRIVVAGAVVAGLYYVLPPLRRPIYLGWMYAAYPIGWVVSHLLLGAVFFLVVTPIGLLLRASGRDLLNRRRDPSMPTYWTPHDPGASVRRYFKQF